MPFNGSGSYSRDNGTYTGATVWAQDNANGYKIVDTRHDTHDQDIATALSLCLLKDGQQSPTADLPMAGYKHTNVGAASARTDYARYSQVQDGSALYATGAGSSNAYTLTLSPAITAYAAGQRFYFFANHTNSGAATLNVNAVGAKNIRKGDGSIALESGAITSGDLVEVVYDGTQFRMTSSWGNLRPSVDNTFFLGSSSFGYARVFSRQYTSSGSSDISFTNTSGTQVLSINLSDGSLVGDSSAGGDFVIQRSGKGFRNTIETSITAAGTTAGGAYQLTKMLNFIATCAAGVNDGVGLPQNVAVGVTCRVVNVSGATGKIYAMGSDSINSMSSSTIADRESHTFIKTASTTWYRCGVDAA